MGNVRNYMNCVATIEFPAGAQRPDFVYTVAMIPNVLRYNSTWDHSRFAAAIDEMIRTNGTVTVRENPTACELQEVIKSD
jgi:hypothetical protein